MFTRAEVVTDFLRVNRRTQAELLPPERLSSPGQYSGEVSFLHFVDQDYEKDRHWAFEIIARDSALIVVDLQEDFVNPGNPMCVPEAFRQIPRVKTLIQACRRIHVPVLYTAHTMADDCCHDFYQFTPPVAAGAIREGSPGADIYHEIYPEPGERVIRTKHTYDSFAGTDLDYVLRNHGTRTVIVCGTMTNFCCESTARTAFFKGYHVVFGSDINSTDSPLAHAATLRTMRRGFARVLDYQSIIRVLERGDDLFRQAEAERERQPRTPG